MRACRCRAGRHGSVSFQRATAVPHPCPSPIRERGSPRLAAMAASLVMTTEQRSFARRLRRQATEPEDIIWELLRNRRLGGLKFRRQVPLLGYTVDFLCIDRKLIVEIDGRQHDWEREYDAARTVEIERHGFTVLRFSNAQVLNDRDGVMAAIIAAT